MKVKELITMLEKYNQELDVICYTEDKFIHKDDRMFCILDIESVDKNHAEKVKLDDGTPYLKFVRNDQSVDIVILSVTPVF